MYRDYFPRCTVKGDLRPVSYQHMLSKGRIPYKCSKCEFQFEGSCTRAYEITGDYSALDYRQCRVRGSSTPVVVEKIGEDEVYIPEKCVDCFFIRKSSVRRYYCAEAEEVWGMLPRGLDWGDWEPDYPMIGLYRKKKTPHGLRDVRAIVTRDLVLLLLERKIEKAMKLYMRLNEEERPDKAEKDIEELLKKLEIATKEEEPNTTLRIKRPGGKGWR